MLESFYEDSRNFYEILCYGYIKGNIDKKYFKEMYKDSLRDFIENSINKEFYTEPTTKYTYTNEVYKEFKLILGEDMITQENSCNGINHNALFDDLILLYLYEIDSVSGDDIEKIFAPHHPQLVNNVICNRRNKTSYLNENIDYIKYDEKTGELSITDKGKREIEKRYQGRRK
ncbi:MULTISPECIES: hypothetical protein [Campylobacter]|uniref:Uncharacterized protein n=1 Tax=Campylobacter porcelli TaxID=1660073 RepID=A0ABU7M450_9BACT|nr:MULTISPECIES: hypothetical protein [unclassified Campylobacter]MCR8678366.1 hypothetical protein [Campylobacter sp. RM19072]MCR8695717.1 hypothetical protein [Campylobacter sp. RM19073]MEE3704281.1 hypothetical protein [Campylobacter sp. CX2-8023-23]MEE3743928.1 hypothetical protein [Campylobacter sp. CX2-4855-23]